MREIGHFIGGKGGAGPSGRPAGGFEPTTGGGHARRALPA